MKIIYKSLTWRALVILSSFFVAMLLGLPVGKSLALTIILNLINAALYIGHEIVWSKYRDPNTMRS